MLLSLLVLFLGTVDRNDVGVFAPSISGRTGAAYDVGCSAFRLVW